MIKFLDGRVILYSGDCLGVLAEMPENSVDAVCCDPPYHLTSIVERFGKSGSAPPKDYGDGNGLAAYARAAKGFMGQVWDGGDIAFQVDTWKAVLRVLKPGGYILAFASTRGFWRMCVAIEDAGFITHPMIAWVFGSGFPKATRVKAEGYDGWRYGGQALKPAIEPIYMGQKPFSEKTGTANVLLHGTGAINIDGCRVDMAGEVVTTGQGTSDSIYGGGKGLRPPELGTQQFKSHALGRWPANLIHDGSDEVLAAFPDTAPSNIGKPRGAASGDGWGMTATGAEYDDEGSAARFFYAVEKEERCDLCRVLLNGKHAKDSPCDANIAETSSPTLNTLKENIAHGGAAVLRRLGSEGKKQPSSSHASIAESSSLRCLPISECSVQSDALTQEASKIAPNVKSAATLCDLCATDIALALAGARQRQSAVSTQFRGSISARSEQILRQHLALYVAGRESTDTILTTVSLKTLLGSVFHAIDSTTHQSEETLRASQPKSTRFWYSSKADSSDRIGSKHPTVKPVDLMRYLCRLVTPPGGTVLDPFAGTGTTGEAAWREGFNAVLIEREPEYQADIAERMRLCLAGPDEKRREIIKRRGLVEDNAGPLFGGAA